MNEAPEMNMNTAPLSSGADPIASVISRLTSSTSRRTVFRKLPAVVFGMLFARSFVDEASASPRRGRSSRAKSAGDVIVIPVGDCTITIEHFEAVGSCSSLMQVFSNDDPTEPVHRVTHSGHLTDETIDLIELVADLAGNPRSSHVNRFNALLSSVGLEELTIPRPVQPDQNFTLIVVTLLSLIFVGAGFGIYGE